MTKRMYAVVILCCGNENLVNVPAIKTVLPDAHHVSIAGPEDLSKGMLSSMGNLEKASIENMTNPEVLYTPEEQAIAYIGERFQENLSGSRRNLMDFVSELSTAIMIAKWQHNDIRLENAVDTLRNKEKLEIRRDIRKKYAITDTVLTEILKIANRYV